MSRSLTARSCRAVVLAGLYLGCAPVVASADWLLTPFLGVKLDGETNLVDPDKAAGTTKLTAGVSAGWLTNGLLGLEIDFADTPGFFSGAPGGLVAHSYLLTLTGNVLVAVPQVVTRESLRPFVLGGIGVMHLSTRGQLDAIRFSSNFLVLDVGGGAVGRVSPRTSLRFELRRFQNLTSGNASVVGFGRDRVSFWRPAIGLTFRY